MRPSQASTSLQVREIDNPHLPKLKSTEHLYTSIGMSNIDLFAQLMELSNVLLDSHVVLT